MMLHSHASHGTLAELLSEKLGSLGVFLDEVVLHSLLEVLKIIPFLFLTYLFMEFIEHKAGEKTESFLRRSGKLKWLDNVVAKSELLIRTLRKLGVSVRVVVCGQIVEE